MGTKTTLFNKNLVLYRLKNVLQIYEKTTRFEVVVLVYFDTEVEVLKIKMRFSEFYSLL
jgi:hypothetical protein